MDLFDYMGTRKYQTYFRNEQIFKEESSGVFYRDVISRVKLELMGSGAVVSGDNVLAGFNNSKASYSPISSLIVPSTLLSSSTSTFITYSTNGEILFDGVENDYLKMKIKEMIKIQSIGGSVLVKNVEHNGINYLNLYTPLSYFVIYNEFIQDLIDSYNIFNLIKESENLDVYLIETHVTGRVEYRKLKLDKESKSKEYINCIVDGLSQGMDDNGVIFSYELLSVPIVTEVQNVCFGGESDYTEDNVALQRELVVTNTINSQTFDKISNPLLALPEEALEYDSNGNAKVNLTERVIIIRDGGNKPEQIKLESKIEQAQIHKGNIEDNIFSSLGVNKAALGLVDVSQISGESIKRMMSSTIARVEEKRSEAAKAIEFLLGIEVQFSEVILPSFNDKVESVSKAVTAGVMSQEKGTTIVSGADDWKTVQKEKETEDYQGFVSE